MPPFRLGLVLLGVILAAGPAAEAQNETATETPSPETGRPAVDAGRLLLTLAAIIGLGFLGFLVFDRFRIADTIPLIGFGILLAAWGVLDPELLRSFQPVVAAFAVLIIMFDASLGLRFGDLAVPQMGWGVAFSTLGFLATLGLVAAIGHHVLGLSWILALILGCAVTDTAGMVILPIVHQLGVPGRVKTALLVETSLPDVYAVTLVLVLLNVVQPGTGASTTSFDATDVFGGIATTLVFGFLAGLLWVHALAWLATRRYAYMTTLAAVLALNWVVGAIGGSGPVAVLLFGLVIGNRAHLGRWADVGRPKVFRDMAQFNGEVAFLVRSFFFVYLGAILDVGALTRAFVLVAGLIVGAILVARTFAVYAMGLAPGSMRGYRGLLVATIPRGTTAAVVSTLPATRGVTGTEAFASYAVAVILLTNVFFTVGLYLFFRRGARPARGDDGSD